MLYREAIMKRVCACACELIGMCFVFQTCVEIVMYIVALTEDLWIRLGFLYS